MATIYALRARGPLEYRYVGITTRKLDLRIFEHKRDSRLLRFPIHHWIQKHKENLIVDIIDDRPMTDKELFFLEKMWISTLRQSGNRLLNVTEGGEGSTGRRHSEEVKKKIAETLRGIPHTPERRANQSKAAKGRKYSEEHKAAISERIKGETNPFYGKTHTEENRLATSKRAHDKHQEIHMMCYWCRAEEESRMGRTLTLDEVISRSIQTEFSWGKSNHRKHTVKSPTCYFCHNPKAAEIDRRKKP